MKSKKHHTISYTFIIGDLFHYGHLQLLQNAKKKADYHICGVISDITANQWEPHIVCNYNERKKVIENLNCVDEVLIQNSKDPLDNLKIIHSRFPNARIILFQGHQKWGDMPGSSFIKSIGGETIQAPYYSKLSRDKIVNTFFKEAKSSHINANYRIGPVSTLGSLISTKANTLQNLKTVLNFSRIEQLFVFTVTEWEENSKMILINISSLFKNEIVIRSSSLSEDQTEFSNAGHYISYLNTNPKDENEVTKKISSIIDDYKVKDKSYKSNQILIQNQTKDVEVSGVVFTRNQRSNTPYYLINYDDMTGSTESVTSGEVGKKIEIRKSLEIKKIKEPWSLIINAVKEIELLLSGMVLDIEFAITKTNEVIIFQVRPLAANRKYHGISDDIINEKIDHIKSTYIGIQIKKSQSTIYSDMAFWNPAEIIGDSPNYLAYSLYSYLITSSSWNTGLRTLGYREVDQNLMILFGSKPYINFDYSCLSLSPKSISKSLAFKLVNFYKNKLIKTPELHDKVEFEIIFNCFYFGIDKDFKELLKLGFSNSEILELKLGLRSITNSILGGYTEILSQDKASLDEMNSNRLNQLLLINTNSNWREKLIITKKLLADCKQKGTEVFSRAARLAFIGKKLLNSIKKQLPNYSNQIDLFYSNIKTIASELEFDFKNLGNEIKNIDKFMKKYGHLRPSSYNICQMTYGTSTEYFDLSYSHKKAKSIKTTKDYKTPNNLINRISKLCSSNLISSTGQNIFSFIEESTKSREIFKFEFTKNLSVALELLADAGAELGFSRTEMSCLDYYSLLTLNIETINKTELINIWNGLSKVRKQDSELHQLISLPQLIFSEDSFDIIESINTIPNFVTEKSILANIEILSEENQENQDLKNKIIVLEKADPGYDWIFTKGISGLITKYGGAASHMSIRCAEFDLPAAIGCGALYFDKLKLNSKIILDCENKKIHFL